MAEFRDYPDADDDDDDRTALLKTTSSPLDAAAVIPYKDYTDSEEEDEVELFNLRR